MDRMLASSGGLVFGLAAAVGYAFFALIVITLDRFRANSTSKDDTQVELKILLYALALMGLFLASDGLSAVVATIASGFKGAAIETIKNALPAIAVGAGTYAAMFLVFLSRTNAQATRSAEALALLTVGLYFGGSAISGAHQFLGNLVMSGPWENGAVGLAKLIVDGAIAFLGLTRLGALSGWVVPVRAAPPPPQYPPQGGGYPPQGGGYLPQGGGYPPQGGGYPPQGGGYPPQGGGYPPR